MYINGPMAISEKNLDDWARKYDLKRLHKALEANDYKIRLKVIGHLAALKNRESLPHLERLVDDAFVSVLKAAAEAIRSISASHPALAAFEAKIKEKEELELRRKEKTQASFVPSTEEEEREKLEQMARKYSIRKIDQKGLREERKQIFDWKVASAIVGVVAILIWLAKALLFS
ncbi:MAG: hypothetical protein Roseis2KO_26310 [Roseivirga sp.]